MARKGQSGNSRISRLSYIPALASFIPLLGIPFGLTAILWGATRWRNGGKPIVFLAAGGILISIVIYGSLGIQLFRYMASPEYAADQAGFAQISLSEIHRDIEYYKIVYGEYPGSLHELNEASEVKRNYEDLSSSAAFPPVLGNSQERRHEYYYRLFNDGSSYYLFGYGLDNRPFTEDDVYPSLPAEHSDRLGLVTPTPNAE